MAIGNQYVIKCFCVIKLPKKTLMVMGTIDGKLLVSEKDKENAVVNIDIHTKDCA